MLREKRLPLHDLLIVKATAPSFIFYKKTLDCTVTVHHMMIHEEREIYKTENESMEVVMNFTVVNAQQWKEIKDIYMEAFPKREREVLLCRMYVDNMRIKK